MIVKIIGVALLSCAAVLILRNFSSQSALFVSVFCGIVILGFCLLQAKGFLSYFIEICRDNRYGDYFAVMVKALGISVICTVGADICRDCNEHTLADRVELAGKVELLIIALPLLQNLIELSEEILIK